MDCGLGSTRGADGQVVTQHDLSVRGRPMASYQIDYDEEVGFAAVRHPYDMARDTDDRTFFLAVSSSTPTTLMWPVPVGGLYDHDDGRPARRITRRIPRRSHYPDPARYRGRHGGLHRGLVPQRPPRAIAPTPAMSTPGWGGWSGWWRRPISWTTPSRSSPATTATCSATEGLVQDVVLRSLHTGAADCGRTRSRQPHRPRRLPSSTCCPPSPTRHRRRPMAGTGHPSRRSQPLGEGHRR